MTARRTFIVTITILLAAFLWADSCLNVSPNLMPDKSETDSPEMIADGFRFSESQQDGHLPQLYLLLIGICADHELALDRNILYKTLLF
ncbi:hypothetical protein ACFL6K_06975 [Candidatus Latescibacterota bacterium]